ncbi:MAG: thioredoxin family protein, partial [Victivallales bacterium]|nr:thioredoxin family protein [Victivallales bacterium]
MKMRVGNIHKWFALVFLLCIGLSWASDESKWLGIVLKDEKAAKRYALENNRPLVVEVGYEGCGHCKNFYDRVFSTSKFLQFAIENRLVLVKMQDQINASDTWRAFNTEMLRNGTNFPMLMMFHVKPTANLNNNRLDRNEVELCFPTWDPRNTKKTGLEYPRDQKITVLGVEVKPENSWSPEDCIALIEKFFPNDFWTTLSPNPVPEGYESALNLGRIWDDLNVPMKDGEYYDADWTQRYNVPAQTGVDPVFWFKFTGHQGVRYFFETQNPKLTSSKNITFTAEMFDTQDGKPIAPALGSVTSTNFDTLANGFWFDAPAGDELNQTYYLRIQGSGGASDTNASFTLRFHEEPSKPTTGTLYNPLWTGAKLGQWTMDYDAALAASRKDGKPIVFYFAAVHWCPHCLGWEHLALSTPTFASRSANYYLVVLDSRRRNGSGPALMMDKQDGGYCKTWKISDAAATAKLADTRTVEVALSRGKSATTDYPDGRIGSPTFLLVRAIEGNGPLYPGLDVVIRAGGVWTSEDDVNHAFDDFEELNTANYAETQQYPEATNPNSFMWSGQTLTTWVAGKVPAFARASVVSGKFWQFDVPAVTGYDVTATLTVWNE